MLVNHANELQRSIRTVQDRSRSLEYVHGIQSLAQKLAEKASEVDSLVGCRTALAVRGTNIQFSASSAAAAAEALRSVRARIDADIKVSADPVAFAATFAALNRIVSDLRNAIRVAWNNYADNRIPSLNSDVLDVLRRIRDLSGQVGRVEQRLKDLKLRREVLPSRGEEIDAFDAAVKEVETLWHNLGGDSVPIEVLRFLQNSGTGGAKLDALTPLVTEWLRTHRLWSAFRITIAREEGTNPSRRTV